MKTFFAISIAALSLAATSCSTTRSSNSSIHLAGDWRMGGPYNVGQPCHVTQAGTDLTFINEQGNRSEGVLVTRRSEVIALDWENGLVGLLSDDNTRINWRNGTWWVRDKRSANSSTFLAGDWKMGGPYNVGRPFYVTKDGDACIFDNGFANQFEGVLISEGAEVIALDSERARVGVLSDDDARISWQNGTWWVKDKQ